MASTRRRRARSRRSAVPTNCGNEQRRRQNAIMPWAIPSRRRKRGWPKSPCRASQVGILRLSGKRFEPSIQKKRKILIPTWVYSCCVRHEENRSENCRIVFPQMGVSRMGYGYCNIIYGQIRQKSLIFFCLSVIPFVTRPPPLLSSPMVETPALKETFRKTQRGDHF